MNGSAWRWTGASIIGRKLAIQDDMDYKGQHWFRKARKKRHYESLVLVSSAEGQVEKRAQTSYHQQRTMLFWSAPKRHSLAEKVLDC